MSLHPFANPLLPRHRDGAPSRSGAAGGYSLVELLLTITLVAILAAVLFSFSSEKLRKKAERTGCESHLKTLHSALNVYRTDHGEWPQMPEKDFEHDDGAGEASYWEWWVTTLQPYGITDTEWLCPTDVRERRANQKPEDRERFEGSYAPTHFDSGPNTPLEWRMPWLMERSGFHGDEPLAIFPDGTIEPVPWGSF